MGSVPFSDVATEIKRGRESLGWSLERMAANVGLTVEQYAAEEDGSMEARTAVIAHHTLVQRGCVFEGNRFSSGPNDDGRIKAIKLTGSEESFLRGIPSRGLGMILECAFWLSRSALVTHGLVQRANARLIVYYDTGEEVETQPQERVRLSARGRRWMELNG